jgi:hypothetical protein
MAGLVSVAARDAVVGTKEGPDGHKQTEVEEANREAALRH